MDNEISNKYIKRAINDIKNSLGVKEAVFKKKILSLIGKNKVKEASELIALQLGLSVKINIQNVSDYSGGLNNKNKFHSSHLVKYKGDSGGSEGIIAQANIPVNLPFYGSPDLDGFLINLRVSDNCQKHPIIFMMIISHELSHVLLYSLNHSEKENEFYTDLIAITQGFKDVFKKGRKNTTIKEGIIENTAITTKYGYLNDAQFEFALNKIEAILRKNRQRKIFLQKRCEEAKGLLLKYKKEIYCFKFFLESLTNESGRKEKMKDFQEIREFFKIDYVDELVRFSRKCKNRLTEIKGFLKNLTHYNNQSLNKLSVIKKDLGGLLAEISEKIIKLRKDNKILSRNVRLKNKINLFIFFFKQKIKNFAFSTKKFIKKNVKTFALAFFLSGVFLAVFLQEQDISIILILLGFALGIVYFISSLKGNKESNH